MPIVTTIEVPTGKLEEAVQDQIYSFVRCIATLPDRTVLMKVNGMSKPFILRVHDLEDPYLQLGLLRCPEWREFELRRYIAQVRKAHPYYFLPSMDAVPADLPVIVQKSKPKARPRHPELVEDDPMG